LVHVSQLNYVGNHGLEIEGPSIHYVNAEAKRFKGKLFRLARKFKVVFEPFNGVFVENKSLTLSIHYKNLSTKKINLARGAFLAVVKSYVKRKWVIIRKGKKVWEIRPDTGWNKGSAVQLILQRISRENGKQFFPIYIGDDETDEDAFRIVRKNGFSVKVTNQPTRRSKAHFHLKSPAEVNIFLKRFVTLLKKTRASHNS
ncbi:MAG: trehalose-phosphatase, partial [Candidatus Omnitrophica bacterium]|nr:trehalose-phosphatase [Candidatus Omnitrophota bacterium]